MAGFQSGAIAGGFARVSKARAPVWRHPRRRTIRRKAGARRGSLIQFSCNVGKHADLKSLEDFKLRRPLPPMFFISVDSGGFRCAVSCLESTLVGWFVSVAYKRVRAGMVCRESLTEQEREKRENEKE